MYVVQSADDLLFLSTIEFGIGHPERPKLS
jgi:hypothetical protein